MPGVLSGLNHSLEIQAWGRTRKPALREFVVQGDEAVLKPSALDGQLEVLEPDFEQLFVRQFGPGKFLARHGAYETRNQFSPAMVSRRRLEVNTENRSRGAFFGARVLFIADAARDPFRQIRPAVVTGFPRDRALALCVFPGIAAFNPGLQTATNKKEKRMRNAVRRRPILRNLRCGAHPAGRARLPAFHRGSSLGTHASRGATPDQVSRRWRLGWRGSPAGAGPGCSEHLACRS